MDKLIFSPLDITDIELNNKPEELSIEDILNNDEDTESSLNNSEVFKMPFKVQTPEGVFDLTIRNLQVDVFFPWPRTFEVYLDVRLNLYRLNN